MDSEIEATLPSVMASTIEAALLHYQKHVQNRLEERSVGKGKEKASPDSSLQEAQFESQLLAVQVCLPQILVMVMAVVKNRGGFVKTPPEPTDDNPVASPLGASSIEDDTPYENPFTGQIIHPRTLFTPGPSSVVECKKARLHQDEEARVAALRSELGSFQDPAPKLVTPDVKRRDSANLNSGSWMPPIQEKRQHTGVKITSESVRGFFPTLLGSVSTYAHQLLKTKENSRTPSVLPSNHESTTSTNERSSAQATRKEKLNQHLVKTLMRDEPAKGSASKHSILDIEASQVPTNQDTRNEYSQPPLCEEIGSTRPKESNTPEARATRARTRSPLQELELKLHQISKEEKRIQVPKVEQKLRDLTNDHSEKIKSPSPSVPESSRGQLRSQQPTSNQKTPSQAAPVPETQENSWMTQFYADRAVAFHMRSEGSTMHQPEIFQQAGHKPEPWVAQFNADRAAALAIAGDVPQDFEAFIDISRKQEAMVSEEQRLARRLIEEREEQEMEQKLAATRALCAQWDAETTKVREQAQYAQELWDEERQRVADAEISAALARTLQAEWQVQSDTLQEQEAYARQLWEYENEALAQFESSRELAQRLQAEWEGGIGDDYQDETFSPQTLCPASVVPTSNIASKFPIERPTNLHSEKDIPPRQGQTGTDPHQSQPEAQWLRQRNVVSNATSTQKSQPGLSTGAVPDAIRSLPFALQQRFLEAQKIQDTMNEQVDRENRDWAIKQELYRKQELGERQREVARLQAQREARRIEAERKETQRRAAEAQAARLKAQQQALKEAKRKRETEAECAVCGDAFERKRMAILSCRDAYCGPCISECFHHALKAKKPFQCCKARVAVQTVSVFLNPGFVATYQAWVVEVETPNPLYCHQRRCASFIPPGSIEADIGTCRKCGERTCRLCRNRWHSGVCKGDREGEELLKTARRQHWQTCPKCKMIVERSEGCLHMTCKCGAEFCYNCGKYYPRGCNGKCPRRF